MPPTYSTASRETLFALIRGDMRTGTSLRRACEAAGVSPGTYKDWEKRAEGSGGLADQRRHASGRKAAITLTEAESVALQRWFLRKEGSFAAAVEFFVQDAACQPATRAFILGKLATARTAGKHPVWPVSLRRCAQIPAGVRERWFGPKSTQHAAPVGRYARTVILPDGRAVPLRPGFAWTFDDYSTNQPYVLDYATGRERLCRQILCGMDVATHGWLGFLHVGKEKDAYTAGDVLDVIRLCIEGQGHVPQVLILEQGRWKGNAVRGIEMEGPNSRRWGSIEDAGIILDFQWDSRGKAEIENGFDLLQTWLASGGAELGRVRGIMEREALDYVAINAGKKARGGRDALASGFLTLAESAADHELSMAALNARPKNFRELARVLAPDDLLAEEPFEARPLQPEHRWLFFPVKDTAAVRENGNVIKTVNGREHVFHVNGVNPEVHLPNGYRVFIAFDPLRPELGCHIANRESGSANWNHWRLGECLLPAAPALSAAPRIDLRTRDEEEAADTESWKARQGAVKSARTAFRTILPGGKRGLRADTARNRAGDRVEMVSGSSAPEGAPGSASQTPREIPRPARKRAGMDIGSLETEPRHPRLKTHANNTADGTSADAGDLDAAEDAFLATL